MSELLKYTYKSVPYKGEYYWDCKLTFSTWFIFTKTITYHITMFENMNAHRGYWDNIIKERLNVPRKLIKDRKIF